MNTPNAHKYGMGGRGWLLLIGIVVLVAVLLAPVLQPPPRPRPSCMAKLHRLGLAITNYTAEWDDHLPPLRSADQHVPDGESWTDALEPFLRRWDWKTYGDPFRCYRSSQECMTYAYNRRFLGAVGIGEIEHMSETVMVFDSVNDSQSNNNLNGDTAWSYRDRRVPRPGQYVPWDGPVKAYTKRWPKWAQPRHEGGNNVLFADGHVKSMAPDEIPRFDPGKPKDE